MNKFLILFFIFLLIFSKNIYSNNISVIDIEYLVDNNKFYLEVLEKIKNNQEKYKSTLKLEEKNLENQLKEIESSKVILSNNEISNMIDNYNIKLQNFENDVNEYNLHYQNQISSIRNIIIDEIIEIIENYARANQIDLILNSKNYLMASNNINITNNIETELNKIIFELKFDSFEKN